MGREGGERSTELPQISGNEEGGGGKKGRHATRHLFCLEKREERKKTELRTKKELARRGEERGASTNA